MESLDGVWHLSAWSAMWAYELDGAVDEFLYQDPATPSPRSDDAGEVHGSTLTIDSAGGFFQVGQCDTPILTYDAEGVQVQGVAEFGGTVRQDGRRGYLLCRELPERATPADPNARARLRYDDGDTKVCDSLRLVGGRLVRTICVVTDECYGDRVVLLYER